MPTYKTSCVCLLVALSTFGSWAVGTAQAQEVRYYDADGHERAEAAGAFIHQEYLPHPGTTSQGTIRVTYFTANGIVMLDGSIENHTWHGPYTLTFSGGEVLGHFAEGKLQPQIDGSARWYWTGEGQNPFEQYITTNTAIPFPVNHQGDFFPLALEYDLVATEILDEDNGPESTEIFDVVEDQPSFPGGSEALYQYIGEQIIYPDQARRMGIQGRVYVRFVVRPDGRLTDIETVRGIGAGCDEEGVRVVRDMPPWNPGRHRGRAVSVRMIVPITFKLS